MSEGKFNAAWQKLEILELGRKNARTQTPHDCQTQLGDH